MSQEKKRHLWTTIPCAGALLANASRGTAYELAKAGEISFMQVGRKKIVTTAWLEAKLEVGYGGLDHAIDEWMAENG